MLVQDKDYKLSKKVTRDIFKDVKTSDELLRREKRIVDEVVTGIYGLLGNDAADAAFIKFQYISSTCNEKSFIGFFLHGYRNTSIISQSVLS